MGFKVNGLGVRVRVWGLEFKVQGVGCRVQGFKGLEFWVWDSVE